MRRLPVLGPTGPLPAPAGEAGGGAAGEGPLVAPPEEVKIRLLQPCDLRCGMCWHWQDPEGRSKRLPEARLLELLAELGALGVRRVKLTGGEPTLRPELCRMVSAAAQAGLRVTLATNAFSLTPARSAALVSAGVDTFHVSLDGADPQTHDAIRGVPGAFHRTVAALGHLRDAHPAVRCKLATVVQRGNIGQLAPLAELAAGLGVRHIYLLLVHTEPFCEDAGPTPEQLQRYYFSELPALLMSGSRRGVLVRSSPLFRSLLGLPQAQQAAALLDGPTGAFQAEVAAYAAQAYGSHFYTDRPCLEITARAEIAETGEVYPCCHTELPELSMGNIYHERFGDIWARSRYRAFRDPAGPLPRHERCVGCKDSHYA